MMIAAPALTEARFPIMGSAGHVLILDGPPDLAERAQRHLRRLEGLWTRFASTSEISAINSAAGEPVPVGAATRALVDRMVMAWELTGGRFDPTVGTAMEKIGYDRSFAEGLSREGTLEPFPGDGCEGVVVDHDRETVMVPAHVNLDPGGIGKGLAADMVSQALVTAGVAGVLVNVGGDLKVAGEGPVDGAWRIDIAEPAVAESSVLELLVPGGSGIASSTPLRRTWRLGDDEVHHLIDPVTGLPYPSVARLLSVVAADAWWAEVCTKQIAGLTPQEATGLLRNASALMVDASGVTHLLRGMEEYAA